MLYLVTTMDAYSISVTSPAQRTTSRIYQDLRMAVAQDPWEVRLGSPAGSLERRSQAGHETGVCPHVGIIGAGLAGLRCADVLLRSGFRVTILEARDRLGGRMHQERLPNGHWADLGPNWIHGTVDNPMMELARRLAPRLASGTTMHGR